MENHLEELQLKAVITVKTGMNSIITAKIIVKIILFECMFIGFFKKKYFFSKDV